MKISDVICKCGACYLRAELAMLSHPRKEGRFNCSACGATLETWDGTVSPVYRLTDLPMSQLVAALH